MDNPNYYAIIPAIVRYDKDLTPNAKLLYGEITALCNEKGYCWSGDKYFMDLYSVSRSSIQNWLKSLEDKKLISREVQYKDGSQEILNRYIKLIVYPIQENLTPYTKKLDKGMQKNWTDNNTYISNTINNTIEYNNMSGDAITSVKSPSSKNATMNDKAEYFIKKFNEIMAIKGKNREFKVNEDVKKKLKKAIDGGYTFEDIKTALENLKKDEHHIKTGFKYATPEFILRLDKLERFRNLTPIIQNKKLIV